MAKWEWGFKVEEKKKKEDGTAGDVVEIIQAQEWHTMDAQNEVAHQQKRRRVGGKRGFAL